MRDYSKIEAWKLADDLTVAVYEKTRTFPKEEIYGLTAQLRRASYSVPANIVEGSSRKSKKDYLHFLYIACGSLAESQYFIHLAHRLNYIRGDEAEELKQQARRVFGCLYALIQSVEKEAGTVGRVAAVVTSMLAIGLARWSGPHLLS